jgi:hypothetical protein
MKALFVFFVAITAFATNSLAQTPAGETNIEIKVGTQLVYEVHSDSIKYQFIITIKKLDDGITFDWQMTAPINKKGTVEMTDEAVESATGLFNFFSAGQTKLTTQTSVWISRQTWADMHGEDEMALISLDNGEATGFFREDGEVCRPTYKGAAATMKTSNLKSLVDAQTITVWENEAFPIIVKMDLGWTIELKEIK